MKIFTIYIALASGVVTIGMEGATAQECRTNYYACSLNEGGRIDPANPGCCWSPAAGRPSKAACPPNFYKCDLNAGGKVDPAHPGCCWNCTNSSRCSQGVVTWRWTAISFRGFLPSHCGFIGIVFNMRSGWSGGAAGRRKTSMEECRHVSPERSRSRGPRNERKGLANRDKGRPLSLRSVARRCGAALARGPRR